MIDPEQIQAVRQFGYTAREAEFLILAALHSGYFLRRQFTRFTGVKDGKLADSLIKKLLANQHGTSTVCAHNTQLCRIYSRPFFAALEQEDNRHRRARETFAIRAKIMGLDFVLDHLQYRFLPTESDKVAYFCGDRKIPIEALPAKRYQGNSKGEITVRYFVDKSPIRIDPATGAVALCYVNHGVFAAPGFETWLNQYRALITILPSVQVVYIAASESFFVIARKIFARMFGHSDVPTPDREAYERLQKAMQNGGAGRLTQRDLDRFRELRKRFAEGPKAGETKPSDVVLQVAFLPYNYDAFGTLTGVTR